MGDVRVERTLSSVKGAMLALLEEKRLSEISMAELARAAGVSRATLYSHYPHTREVFTELVGDFCKHVRSLPAQLRHSECAQACRRPFCMTVRAAGPFQPLVLAPCGVRPSRPARRSASASSAWRPVLVAVAACRFGAEGGVFLDSSRIIKMPLIYP